MLRSLLSALALAVGLLGCVAPPEGSPAGHALASYTGGAVTATELDRLIRSLPEAERVVPADDGRAAWLEELLKQVAAQEILAADPAVEVRLAAAEMMRWRAMMTAQLLAAAVGQEIAASVEPDPEEIATVMERIEARQSASEPRLSFRHVFFRLDRAPDAEAAGGVRRRAAEVAERARAGQDFAELAREHSDSADAAEGGLVLNQRPSLLEEKVRQVISSLAEGEVSPLVESRTGLHLFRLERRIELPAADPATVQPQARRLATGAALQTARQAYVAELRETIGVEADALPWRVGSFTVTEADLSSWPGTPQDQKAQIVESLLLAEDGQRRGLLGDEIRTAVDELAHREAIAAVARERLADFVAALPAETLRPIYDAQPSAFAGKPTATVDLIFVPQGRDAFATQQELEKRIAELRAGASFGDLARRLSTGPGAAEGGHLGVLPPEEWARLGPEIYKAIASLEVGEISEPIFCTGRLITAEPRTLRGGFAVLRVTEKTVARPRTFDEASEDVRQAYARRHGEELAGDLRRDLLAAANFEIHRLPTADELLLQAAE